MVSDGRAVESLLAGSAVGGAAEGLEFPDVAKLQLERVLVELIADVERFRREQAEVQALLRASAAIIGEIRLIPTLRRIASATRLMLGAGYGAAGVLVRDGAFTAFAGTTPPGDDAPDHLAPPAAIRLTEPTRASAAAGYPVPPGHLTAVLAGPAPLQGTHGFAANLYVARGQAFNPDDERLLQQFASTAGLVIDAAIGFEGSVRERRSPVTVDR